MTRTTEVMWQNWPGCILLCTSKNQKISWASNDVESLKTLTIQIFIWDSTTYHNVNRHIIQWNLSLWCGTQAIQAISSVAVHIDQPCTTKRCGEIVLSFFSDLTNFEPIHNIKNCSVEEIWLEERTGNYFVVTVSSVWSHHETLLMLCCDLDLVWCFSFLK